MLTGLDYSVIVVYLFGSVVFGLWMAGKQRDNSDYFFGERNLPWWAVSFSIVATETSSLTVISVPAIAYGGTLTFLQITFGYLLGRILVSVLFLPRYFAGELTTAYEFIGTRFGDRMRVTTSVTFMITRLLADGVRLFATAIPVKVVLSASGLEVAYWQIIVAISLVTIAYTFFGGIKAVVWMDVVQMFLYLLGAVLAITVLLQDAPVDWMTKAVSAGKTQILDFSSDWLTSPYMFITAVIGGAVLSMASHGTDYLIVQRLFTTRNLKESQLALVVSGVVIIIQFALFLFVGLMLWVHYGGASPADLGLTRADEIYPKFLIEGLPSGVSGLLLVAIFAAAMSTVSSSLNSLSAASVMDLYKRLANKTTPESEFRMARIMTLVWSGLFIIFANLFQDTKQPIVELGLAIASYTYGGLLGVFLLGLLNKRAKQTDALIAFFVAIAIMAVIIATYKIAWPWHTVIGSGICLLLGSLLSVRQPKPSAQ
ncbi:MAG TPA: sodium:solute symporter [Bacteroidetes bacterium]|nr:sodium:solute symporter [Bacteroidota bacterium]HRR07465.1 sodium:solute symporter [Rhodothermales bacterium]